MANGKSARMSWIATLNKPWLHFIVLGAVLFQVQSFLFPHQGRDWALKRGSY